MKQTNTSNYEMHHINALIAGVSGAGKTYTALTLPPKETLIISAESGLLTLKDSGHDVWEISSMGDMKQMVQMLNAGVNYKNIFLDSLTEMSDIIFTSLRPNYSKQQNFGLYEEYCNQMITFIKTIRDMNRYNFFMTTLIKESTNGVIVDVAQKSLGEKIPAYFDFVFYVATMKEESGVKRALITDNSIMPFCKSRSNKIELIEPVNLTNIINKVMAKQETK